MNPPTKKKKHLNFSNKKKLIFSLIKNTRILSLLIEYDTIKMDIN